MKRSIILTLLLLILGALPIIAQKVSISARNRPAEKVFAELMERSGKNFIYPAGLLSTTNVTVNANNRPLPEVLDIMLAGTNIGYKIRGNNVLLFRKETPKPAKATISGFVREDGSEESLPGVIVTAWPSEIRTASNAQGFYSLTVPAGTIAVSFTATGFEDKRYDDIHLTFSRKLDVNLHEDPKMLEGVTVIGNQVAERAVNSAEIGSMKVSRSAISSTPVIFGESDLIKTSVARRFRGGAGRRDRHLRKRCPAMEGHR